MTYHHHEVTLLSPISQTLSLSLSLFLYNYLSIRPYQPSFLAGLPD